MDSSALLHYPLPSDAGLKNQYVGRSISEVAAPAAIIDRAVAKRNCKAMLEVAKRLNVGFRAHIKTHKTIELSRLQVGATGLASFIVSTVMELEQLLPLLLELQAEGRSCSVLYGMPLPPSNVQRLINLAKKLEPLAINVLIDHPDQVEHFEQAFIKEPDIRIGAFIKVDTGYHRSGVAPESATLKTIVDRILLDRSLVLSGFYSHLGHSYGGNSAAEAIGGLIHEIRSTKDAVDLVCKGLETQKMLTISVGTTPTATAVQNILMKSDPTADEVRKVIEEVGATCHLELHAGVYPLLDLQQLATHARPNEVPRDLGADSTSVAPLSVENIGLRMLVEVASLYDDRGTPEALIGAGTLALGREPCKSYPGWGIVTPWEDSTVRNDHRQSVGQKASPVYDETSRTGWIIGRISQEHGILVWQGDQRNKRELRVGQKLLVWPNHACVAGAGSGWYLVVDSDEQDPDKIVDVWVRWRGW
ncbi:uncharacterized protein BDZ99DRAFT_458996 [Mytilinidion resinicola]|uniref:D-serine dehydratase n=1 Tax=Mytilinidion resinicola TaxID=574789 RepID=A0A6A6Z1L0_9PEZI|nr:uncharacterized protein BDZ99DRAFT_458996 [Mytilinidion resinicola]KAF2815052.1 hypothetical protein BDZ99DRAFT_458996 [Mytilinidion resinicola]